jgi:hypothetical protein
VVLGGVGTLLVIGLWAWIFPDLRRLRSLDTLKTALPQSDMEEGEGLR